MRDHSSVAGAKRERQRKGQRQRHPKLSRQTPAPPTAAPSSSLKKFLVTSAPRCWYWLAATSATSLRYRAEGWVPRPTVAHGRRTIFPGDYTTRAASGRPFYSKWFSTAKSSDADGTGKETPAMIDCDSNNKERGIFATSYHAPVMVNECLDALLDCQRGRIRNPIPFSDLKKKKRNKKRRKRKHDEPTATATEEIIATGNTNGDPLAAEPDQTPPPPLVFVDGTLGGGGHSSALLQRMGPGDVLFGCDVDPNALKTATERLGKYANHSGTDRPLFVPVRSNFGDLAEALPGIRHPVHGGPILGRSSDETIGGGVDGILLDLGVSSHQIDEPERGFSFMRDGPLDMRMGRNDGSSDDDSSSTNVAGGLTAADVCNEFDEGELQRIFSVYGDEPKSKTIARAIVKHRPLHTTGNLVEAIASVTPKFAKNKRHGTTATCARVFQSLRIVVNNEDGVLSKVLSEACPGLLRPGGMLVVMSYHSMEDRATKRIMRDGTLERRSNSNRETDLYGNYIGPPKPFKPVRKRQKATEEEVEANPRARSAVLRVAERLDPDGLPYTPT